MLLVDGHNLIGQLRDLSLDDPYDEAKLTLAIRSYCMRTRKKATVIFDNGLPGGVSKQLSNSDCTVIFAPSGTQADSLLIRRAREMNKQQDALLLVTSDRQILRLASALGIKTLSSPEFAIRIGFRPVEMASESSKASTPQRVTLANGKESNPVVTTQDVAYWLPIFEQRLELARTARAARGEKGANGKPRRK